MKIKHLAGQHICQPVIFPFGTTKCEFYFTEKSKYFINSEDQYDWNKLMGVTANLADPSKNASMIGWRYHPRLGCFQVTPYFNVNKKQIYEQDIINLKVNQKCFGEANKDRVFISSDEKTIDQKVPSGLKSWIWFRIQPWFGGNTTPKTDVEYEMVLNSLM